MRRIALPALAFAGILVAGGCKPQAPAAVAPPASSPNEPPDVVLITIDALRPDHLGVYGYPRPTSPRIDAFAQEAVVFETAVAQASYTIPSVAALLTGNHPLYTGEKFHPLPLDPANETLAEVLAAAGYDTAAFVDNGQLMRLSGWDQGFAAYLSVFTDEAAEMYARAAEWLAQPRERPIFLWVHFLDPHAPYRARASYDAFFREPTDTRRLIDGTEVDDARVTWNAEETRNAINLYDSEVRHADEFTGRLLDRLGAGPRWKNTLVLIAADHGEAFMDHGHKSHGYDVFDTNIRVPLVIRPPTGSKVARRRVAEQARLIDLFPTILDYAGLPPRPVQGVSLRPLIEGASFVERPSFSQASSGDFCVRTRAHKGMRFFEVPGEFWIDLRNDPGETRLVPWNEIPPEPKSQADSLMKLLDQYIDAWEGRRPARREELDETMQEALRRLGYLRDSGDAP